MDSARVQRRRVGPTGPAKGRGFFEGVLNAVDQPVLVVDPNTYRVAWANTAAKRTLSGDGTFCYTQFRHLTRPCAQEGWPCPLDEVKKTGRPATSEQLCIDPCGNPRRAEVTAHPLFDEHGSLAHVVVALTDSSPDPEAEAALKESRRLLDDIGEVAKIGGWEMNLITRTAAWTQSTYDIVGVEPGQPIPGPDEHLNYYLPEHRPVVAEAMRALIEENEPLEFEAAFRTPSDQLKWCRVHGRAERQDGRCVRVYGTLQDITEHRRIVQELEEHKERLEELVQQRTQELAERLKELNCLYRMADVAEEPGISMEQLVQRTLDLVPAAFRFPETTCARIRMEGREYLAGQFKETPWKLASNISVFGDPAGLLEVFSLTESCEAGVIPFLGEEGELLAAVAERLGRVIERKKTEALMDLAKFPSENPNPVLRVTKDGRVLYSNDGGRALLTHWHCDVGGEVPERWRRIVAEVSKLKKAEPKRPKPGTAFSPWP